MVKRSTLRIFYITLFICGPVISNQTIDGPTLPVLLQETWHRWPFINKEVTLIEFDEHLALYHDSISKDYIGENNNYYNADQWPFYPLSIAWKYVIETYGPIGPDSHLFIILHESRSLNLKDVECSNLSFLNPSGGHRNIIDCRIPVHQLQNGVVAETVHNFETIFPQMGDIIRYGAEGMHNDADRKICGTSISDFIFYDIYRHLRLTLSPSDVYDWKEMLRNPGARWDKGRTCFSSWFIPIYEEYGGASVLIRYFELTKKYYWKSTGRDRRYTEMNLGEFLHFWSGAAKKDLQYMAAGAFGWTVDQQDELVKARAYFQFKYPYDYNYTVKNEIDISRSWTSEESLHAFAWPCVAIVAILMVFFYYIVRNKTEVSNLENHYIYFTAQDVDAFRVGSLYMNLEDVGSDLPILSMPFNMAFEVPAERIAIDETQVLGQGEFGIVYFRSLKGESGTPDVKVAVKTPKLETQVSHFKAFLSEIKIMAHLEKHENIAALLATVTLNISKCEVIAALEFCEKGDLLGNLRSCRRSFRNLWNQHYSKWTKTDYVGVNTTTQPSTYALVLATESENIQEISTLDLVSWAGQIANGMMYLSSKNIIHGDLAARNVLLTAENITKISDFGLSRQLLKYSNYYKTSSTPIPWKSLAIEALTQKTFTIQSDVWSFGVTLWEMFTLGQEPYPGRIWDQICR